MTTANLSKDLDFRVLMGALVVLAILVAFSFLIPHRTQISLNGSESGQASSLTTQPGAGLPAAQ